MVNKLSLILVTTLLAVLIIPIYHTYAAPTIVMSDTTASFASLISAPRQFIGELATPTSVLIGKQIDSITIKLQKVGAPTGIAQVGVFDINRNVVKSFGTIDVSTISTTATDYVFKLSAGSPYVIVSGDRIGFKYTGGSATAGVNVTPDRDAADPFDGANSYRVRYEAAWITSTTEDMYMILQQTNSTTSIPGISINDISLTEGNAGTKNFNFTVTRSGNTTGTSSVNYTTSDGTATVSNSDYIANSGMLVFTPGQTTKVIPILVNGDTIPEPTETFNVNLSSCVGCTITDNLGVGTIQNDDSSSSPTTVMNDTTVSFASLVSAPRQFMGEFASPTSVLVGKQIDSITIKLQKVGAPTGTAQVGVFDINRNVVRLFGTIDVSTISTTATDYEFKLLSTDPLYTIASGDRIGIKYTGGSATVGVNVTPDRVATDPFDGANSYRVRYETAWITATTEDMYMILKQTGSSTPITSISLNPTSGLVGSTVNISGANFTPSSVLSIKFDGVTQTTNPGIITINSTGGFTGSITIPSSGLGGHSINVTDASAKSAQATFTVTLPIVNKTLTIAAEDMNGTAIPGLFTAIFQNGPGTILTGYTPAPFSIHTNAQYLIGPGEYPPYVFDHWKDTGAPSTAITPRFVMINADTTLTGVYVNTLVTLNSTSGPAGQMINVTGNLMPVNRAYAFAPNSHITIKFGGVPVTTIPSSIITSSGLTSSPTTVMNDTTVSFASLVSAPRQFMGEFASPTSVLVGKQIDSITIKLQKVGAPTGTAQVGIFDINRNVVRLFGTIDVSTISTTATDYEFKLLSTDPLYTIASGDRIGIKYTGGSATVGVNVTPDRVATDPFDGANSYRVRYETAWITATTEDMYMILKQTQGVGSSGPGTFNAKFVVPASANGPHSIQVSDELGNTWNGQFIVGPKASITLNPTSTFNGDIIKITGTNFAPLTRVVISYDGVPGLALADLTTPPNPLDTETDNNGGFTSLFQIQYSSQGIHTISATDGSNTASAPFTVTPYALLLGPLTGHNGTKVNFRVTGFAPNSNLTVTFNGVTRPITTDAVQGTVTSADGDLPGSFTVPNIAPNTYPIVFSDANGNTFTRSFVITSSITPVFSTQNLMTGLIPPTSIDGPDAFAFIPDNGPGVNGSGNFMIGYKNGTVIVYKNTGGSNLVPVRQAIKFVDVPAVQGCVEDAGLLGIAFDPQYTTTHQVYVYSTIRTSADTGCDPIHPPGVENRIFRYTAMTDGSGNIVAKSSTPELILGGIIAGTDLNGGHLAFDNQGNLVISTGETYRYTPAQDLTVLGGKVLKIKPLASPDSSGKLYSIPPGNPYASGFDPTIRKEIFSSGLRNPFSFDIDSQTGKIYMSNVGHHTWETILDSTHPHNFGWTYYEGPTASNPQNVQNFTNPIYWYPHNGIEPDTGFVDGLEAIIGGSFYHGSVYPARYSGAYFFGDYAIGQIQALLSTDTFPPITDPGSGIPKGQTDTVVTGLTLAPVATGVWNGKLYYTTLSGEFVVLNYQ